MVTDAAQTPTTSPVRAALARNDEQRLFAESLQKFLQTENEFEHPRRRLRGPRPDRLALWRGLAVEPYLACAVMAGHILSQLADAALRDDLVGRIIAGGLVMVLAHDAGADPFAPPLTEVRAQGTGFVLNGSARCVRHADVAAEFLVTARLAKDTAIFRVPRTALSIAPYRLMDGAGGADLHLANLEVEGSARLLLAEPAQAVLEEALELGLLGLAAETAGIVRAANAATFSYLMARKQFGVPLAAFQALQHRAADLEIAARELDALLELALDGFARGPGPLRGALLAALKSVADTCGRLIGHEAMQLHGGMGVSDELDISHFTRRLATMRAELGSADLHRFRFGTGVALSDLLELQDTPEARAWREQVRQFTRASLPRRIALKGKLALKIEKQDYVEWQQLLRQHELFAGKWPRGHGGQDWDLRKQLLFAQETAVANAPMVSPYGVNMVGPVIYTFGNEEQQRRHLPGILSSTVWWCQGYSEPGAGSDLASLKTTAVLDVDHYVVNGAKLWTTEAHWADWMHCLVRTEKTAKPQNGSTFLLIDMKTPGTTVKPIVTIDGIHHTNALFLDNVRVPVANRVGAEGMGWTIAKFLLGNERVSIADTGPKLRLLAHVRATRQPDGIRVPLQPLLVDLRRHQ